MKRDISRREFLERTALAGAAIPLSSFYPGVFNRQQKALTHPPTASPSSLVLWYDKPAVQWVEALPIGNGRLGAMVFGGTKTERLQLNEDTLYAGGPYDPSNPEALKALPEARRLIFEGKYKEANDLIGAKMMARPIKQMPYEPVGDLKLEFPSHESVSEYRRELNLDTAIAKVSYVSSGATFTREILASPVDQVIVIRLTSNLPGQITFDAAMSTPQEATLETESTDTLVVRGQNGEASGIKGELKFQARVRVIAKGGTTTAEGNKIVVRNADTAMLLVTIATSYKNYKDISGDPEELTKTYLSKAAEKSYEEMRESHVREHQRLFRRVQLDLGTTHAATLSTDQRHAKFLEGSDPQLAALYYQYGRYLLISCSRPDTQPANLQGLWNESMTPPWESKYTININTEMNYWPAEPTNLAECIEPLAEMVADLAESGSRTAKVQYGADGWVCHHNTDLWRATAPIDGPLWGFWPTGGAWLCTHLWSHYEFSGDKNFLSRVYPIMKRAAQFFVDTLVEEPKHKWLVTCPSLSPENIHPGGVAICAGPTMDMEILRDLFSQCIKAAEILDLDSEFSAKLASVRSRLAPLQIGKAGQLQEWLEDWDMEAPERHHRHVSHLYGLYPSNQITPLETPELSAAAKKTLELRGDVGTGWSLAWKINLWARLHDGDHAYLLLRKALMPLNSKDPEYGGGGVYPNLFDAHPPFQIDGNFGATSGITEMLLQSHTGLRPPKVAYAPELQRRSSSGPQAGEIHLLPALPKAWPAGSVKGLRARGGFEVDIAWERNELRDVTIKSTWGTECNVRYKQQVITLRLKPGESVHLDENLQRR
jgi:alpha-L-fucosidase 2